MSTSRVQNLLQIRQADTLVVYRPFEKKEADEGTSPFNFSNLAKHICDGDSDSNGDGDGDRLFSLQMASTRPMCLLAGFVTDVGRGISTQVPLGLSEKLMNKLIFQRHHQGTLR